MRKGVLRNVQQLLGVPALAEFTGSAGKDGVLQSIFAQVLIPRRLQLYGVILSSYFTSRGSGTKLTTVDHGDVVRNC